MLGDPPRMPIEATYTSCWCEENIYLLCQRFSEDVEIIKRWEIFVIFISNSTKTVLLWCQKAAKEPHLPICWDYHVVLLLRPRNASTQAPDAALSTSWIYDFDSRIDMPCIFQDYVVMTFIDVPSQYRSGFRIVPGEIYLQYFASDRSHMIVGARGKDDFNGTSEPAIVWAAPPPPYKPIQGKAAAELGITNNLMTDFVCMDPAESTYGTVETDLVKWMSRTERDNK